VSEPFGDRRRPDASPSAGTGDAEVDAALRALDDLAETPLAEHHDRLAAAHERIHAALDPDRADSGA